MSKLLVTGATGFLGRYVLKLIDEEEFQESLDIDEVYLMVRDPQKASDLSSDIYDYKLVKADLMDHDSLQKAVEDKDIVIHIAAVYDNTSPKEKFFNANVEGTRVIVESMKPDSSLILTSTWGVYGVDIPKDEKITENYPHNPYWHYQTSKAYQEEVARELAQERGINYVIIRPPTVFGPGDYFFIPNIIEGLKSGELVFLRKNGENVMTFGHPYDVARAHLLALARIDKVNGETFHMYGFQPSFKELTDKLAKLIDEDPVTRYVPYWLAFSLATISDLLRIDLGLNRFTVKYLASNCELDQSKIKDKLDFKPKYSMEETLKQSVEWYKKEKPESRA